MSSEFAVMSMCLTINCWIESITFDTKLSDDGHHLHHWWTQMFKYCIKMRKKPNDRKQKRKLFWLLFENKKYAKNSFQESNRKREKSCAEKRETFCKYNRLFGQKTRRKDRHFRTDINTNKPFKCNPFPVLLVLL